MSYIRATQEGEYIDIPDGSHLYLYGDGHGIVDAGVGRYEYETFAGILDLVGEAVAESHEEHEQFREALREEFDGIDDSVKSGFSRPERGEIFLQVLDRRTDVVDVDQDLIDRVQDWVDADGPYFYDCENCGEEFRPHIKDGEPYYCNKDECSTAFSAQIRGITIEQQKELEEALDDEDRWIELYNEYVKD